MDIVNLLYFFRTYLRGIHHTRIRQGQMNHKKNRKVKLQSFTFFFFPVLSLLMRSSAVTT